MNEPTGKSLMHIYLYEVLGKRHFERIADIAAPDMTDQTLPGQFGPAALDAHARGFCANTPDVSIEVLNIVADEQTAVGIWRWHGIPEHPSARSSSGSPVVPRLVCSVFEIKNQKIQDYRVFVDAVDVFSQLTQ